jgi:hypothetical protein
LPTSRERDFIECRIKRKKTRLPTGPFDVTGVRSSDPETNARGAATQQVAGIPCQAGASSQFMEKPMKRRSSPSVDGRMAALIKTMLKLGLHQHQIAAHFKINQGRVSEIRTGKKFASVPPANEKQLKLI